MSKGRLVSVMARLRERTATVRRRSRETAPDLAELLSGSLEAGGDSVTPEAPVQNATEEVAQVQSDGAPSASSFVLVRDGGEVQGPGRAETLDEVTESVETEVVRCSSCGVVCDDGFFVGDGGMLCSECARVQRERPKPTDQWKGTPLDRLSELILALLESVFPTALTARDVVDRLVEQGLSPKKADKSKVNRRLYRDASEWVIRTDETPPRWSLARDTGEEGGGGNALGEQAGRESASACVGCGDDVTKVYYRNEEGVMCEGCAVSFKAATSPSLTWQERGLSPLSQSILTELKSVYPAYATSEALTHRMQRLQGTALNVGESSVTAKLKGPLSPHVRRKDPYREWWALEPASTVSSDEDIDDPAHKDGFDEPTSEAKESETGNCPICEQEVEETLRHYRGFEMCSECVEALQRSYAD